ncbi:hypothetical protein [Candidatus Marithrix sp. Canyon 246]|uniref:hypothetical protein n=1 Tax=Candidatus Marithrix sp. Canyon 246 TaxID=1827136 RepID=UPI00084A11AC|nr:hypothetical protein [Candidatus Marithrix sp. Canyon 246]
MVNFTQKAGKNIESFFLGGRNLPWWLAGTSMVVTTFAADTPAFLRGFKAVYLGIFMNAVIIAWVNVALGSLLQVFFNIPADQVIFYLAGAMFFVMVYSSLSGLLGVVMTDFIQFILAMIGSIILAVIVVNSEAIGGISGLQAIWRNSRSI